jgi:hypothetical protein
VKFVFCFGEACGSSQLGFYATYSKVELEELSPGSDKTTFAGLLHEIISQHGSLGLPVAQILCQSIRKR